MNFIFWKRFLIKRFDFGCITLSRHGSIIIAALAEQIKKDKESIVEVIIPDELNTYDVLLWAKNDNHSIMDQQKDGSGNLRILLKP